MKYLTVLIFLASINLSSCQTKFDKNTWIDNNSMSHENNIRQNMVNDLMENHLKIGMKKSEVIDLLGKPKGMGVSAYIPKNIKFPDSLRVDYNKNPSDQEIEEIHKKSGKWYKENSIQAYFVNYHVGWTLIDPVSLKIKFDDNDLVDDYWIKQH